MSEKELAIINYIVERLGVTEEQAISTLNDAKKSVPREQQNEVIDFLQKNLENGSISTLDGVSAVVQIKVKDLQLKEENRINEQRKIQERHDRIENSYVASIEQEKQKRRDEKSNNQEFNYKELPKLSDEEIEDIRSVTGSNVIENYKIQVEIYNEMMENPETAQKMQDDYKRMGLSAKLVFNDKTKRFEVVCSKKDAGIVQIDQESTVDHQLIDRVCHRLGVGRRTKQGQSVAAQVLLENSRGRGERIREKYIGGNPYIRQEFANLLMEEPKQEDFEILREYLYKSKNEYWDLKDQLRNENDSKKIEELKTKIVKAAYNILMCDVQINLMDSRILVDRGIIDESTYRLMEIAEEERVSAFERIHADELDPRREEFKGKAEEFLTKLIAVNKDPKQRNSWTRDLFQNFGRDKVNYSLYMDTYFDDKIKMTQGRIEGITKKLETETNPEIRALLENDLKSEQSNLEIFNKRDLTDIKCCDFFSKYSHYKLDSILDKSAEFLSKMNEKLEQNPNDPNLLEVRQNTIKRFAESIANSNMDYTVVSNLLLDNKLFNKKDKLDMLLETQREAQLAQNISSVRKNDKSVCDNRFNRVRAITNSFNDAVEQFKEGKSLQEVKDALDYFDKFLGDNNKNMHEFIFGNGLGNNKINKECLSERLDDLKIDPKHKEFFEIFFSKVIDTGYVQGSQIYITNSNPAFYHFVLEAKDEVKSEISKSNQEQADKIAGVDSKKEDKEESPYHETMKRTNYEVDSVQYRRAIRKLAKSREKKVKPAPRTKAPVRVSRKEDLVDRPKIVIRRGPDGHIITDSPKPQEVSEIIEPLENTAKEQSETGENNQGKENVQKSLHTIALAVRTTESNEQLKEIKAASQELSMTPRGQEDGKTVKNIGQDESSVKPVGEGEDREE